MDAVLKHWKIFCFDDFTGNPKVLRNPCIWPAKIRKCLSDFSMKERVPASAGCLPGMREMSGAAEKRTGGCN